MKFNSFALLSFMLFLGCNKTENLSLAAFFSDNMVLQRNGTVQFWGTAANNGDAEI